jgi:putative (di)nucleoside polyphosphate hydrolase
MSFKINRDNLPFRQCVGIMMINDEKKIFVGQRIDNKYDAWQMPQGGVEAGENLEEAAFRELKEEIGTNEIKILARAKQWYSYDIPDHLITKFWEGKYRGQTQMWFLAYFKGKDGDIDLNTHEPEFKTWMWAAPKTLPDIIVPFKRKLYEDLLHEFQDFLK